MQSALGYRWRHSRTRPANSSRRRRHPAILHCLVGLRWSNSLTNRSLIPLRPARIPIPSFSWMLIYPVYKDRAKATALRDFVEWVLSQQAQDIGAQIGYLPLPADVISLGHSRAKRIRQVTGVILATSGYLALNFSPRSPRQRVFLSRHNISVTIELILDSAHLIQYSLKYGKNRCRGCLGRFSPRKSA